jgi:hypothetical protein
MKFMDDLIKYGWIKSQFNSTYEEKFRRIALLMRIFRSQEIDNFKYVIINEYFIDKSDKLYFIGNDEIYKIDLNDNFNYENYDDDWRKIKFICEYNIDNIFKYELFSNKYKRDKRITEILNPEN